MKFYNSVITYHVFEAKFFIHMFRFIGLYCKYTIYFFWLKGKYNVLLDSDYTLINSKWPRVI